MIQWVTTNWPVLWVGVAAGAVIAVGEIVWQAYSDWRSLRD